MKFQVNFQPNNKELTQDVSLPSKHEQNFERVVSKLKPRDFIQAYLKLMHSFELAISQEYILTGIASNLNKHFIRKKYSTNRKLSLVEFIIIPFQ